MSRVRIGFLVTLLAVSASAQASLAESPAIAAEGDSIVACYDRAVVNLKKVCEDYRRIKAFELARVRDIAFADAYRNVQSVMPILKPINRELLQRRITHPDEIIAHKKEVETVESEVDAMIELVVRLLTEIENLEQQMAQTDGPAIPVTSETSEQSTETETTTENTAAAQVEAREQRTESLQKLAAKALENPDQRAVDVSAEMRAMSAAPNALARTELRGAAMSPAQIAAQVFNLKEMNRDIGRQVVSEGGVAVEWMFIDTWYTIGPFPNPQRVNLNTKFPPETIINLGARYPGKDGRTVGWEFLQTNRAICVPLHDEEYAIYYAYTELWFEEATDLWITIGSDDKANVWINNLPVWISGDQLKTWRINEGLRKVHFQKGVNKILYRVENGWRGTAFSLGVQVGR